MGYTFRKRFHNRWFDGVVTELRPRGYRRCVYSDGDSEDLSLAQLCELAKLDKRWAGIRLPVVGRESLTAEEK